MTKGALYEAPFFILAPRHSEARSAEESLFLEHVILSKAKNLAGPGGCSLCSEILRATALRMTPSSPRHSEGTEYPKNPLIR